MSANTELLLEQIKQTEYELKTCVSSDPQVLRSLETKLLELKKRLSSAADALNENKQLLKD